MDGATVNERTTPDTMRRLVQSLVERNAQLEHALESRILIEQAKGVLAERWGVPPEQAFTTLRAAARENRIRVHELARQVVTSPVTPPQLARRGPR